MRGGPILTLSPDRPVVRSIAVSAGRVTAVGSEADVAPLVGTSTRILDLDGAWAAPGFVDAHLHLFALGLRLSGLDLSGARSQSEAAALVSDRAASSPGDGPLVGRGWDDASWPRDDTPHRKALDRTVPDRPVVLSRIDGHAVWVNSAALRLAALGPDSPDPPGGHLERGADGELTGVLVDGAAELVLRLLPEPSPAERRQALRAAARELLSVGVTSVHDAGLVEGEIDVLRELARQRQLPLRVYAMALRGASMDALIARGPSRDPGGFLTTRAVKIYADGALGSRGAALLDDYSDRPGWRGILTIDREELAADLRASFGAGLQPCVHAIGDRTVRVVLDELERCLGPHPEWRALRPRIEHAQVVASADIARFARVGAIASMQPRHAVSDGRWVEARLGSARLAGAYAWRRFLEARVALAFGSDAPVESVDPLPGLRAAVLGAAGGGVGARITASEAIRAYTAGGAWAAFEEEEKGALLPGRLADFAVMTGDPRDVASEVKVRSTWVAGREQYSAEG